MATQQEQLALNDGEKALLEKMKEELEGLKNTTSDQRALARGNFGNSTVDVISLKELHHFSGHWEDGGPASTIKQGSGRNCSHVCTEPQGSKVGVVYFRDNQRWIFAWHIPTQEPIQGPPAYLNKVYYEHESDFSADPIDWEKIEAKLDNSTPPRLPIHTPHFYVSTWQDGREGYFIGICREPWAASTN